MAPLTAFVLSTAACLAILVSRGWHLGAMLRRNDMRAVQAAHATPTPRIGGLALLVVMIAAAVLVPQEARRLPLLGLVALLPVFVAGLAEDLGYPVRPAGRLMAAAVSALTMILAFGLWLPRLDVPLLDSAMAWVPLAMAVTVFCSAGVAHAFNLIDGMNGLAGFAGIVAALGMHVIAREAGMPLQADLTLLLCAAIAGFLVFNFPRGRIFLGDAGAYALGHVLAWLAISMLFRVPELSTWAVLLVFFWPVADTLFAIWRRRRLGRPTGQPDRLHFHQLVMRGLEILVFGRKARGVTNPLTTAVLMPFIAAPALVGVRFWNDPLAACVATFVFAGLFVGTYGLGLALARRRGRLGRQARADERGRGALALGRAGVAPVPRP